MLLPSILSFLSDILLVLVQLFPILVLSQRTALAFTPLHPRSSTSASFNTNHFSSIQTTISPTITKLPNTRLYSDTPNNNDSFDSNKWISSDDDNIDSITGDTEAVEWETLINKRQDGSLWSSFESSTNDRDEDQNLSTNDGDDRTMDDDGESWLNTLAAISGDEIDFINTEADRADKQRQMQEYGFSDESISATLGLAIDESLEKDPENVVFEKFKEETKKSGFGMYVEDVELDLQKVESHTMVDVDEETGDPVRTQMVYVDEVSCIGCTNCAMIAQSTFFMEEEHGRARVFQQWGDDDETIQVAIETCPVDCIHYVPYEELVSLELDRRSQNINNKARLVSQSDNVINGPREFSAAQQISGNMGSRCNNCPSRGCRDCPMYGVGKNPYFEKREKERKEKAARRRMKQMIEDTNRSADL